MEKGQDLGGGGKLERPAGQLRNAFSQSRVSTPEKKSQTKNKKTSNPSDLLKEPWNTVPAREGWRSTLCPRTPKAVPDGAGGYKSGLFLTRTGRPTSTTQIPGTGLRRPMTVPALSTCTRILPRRSLTLNFMLPWLFSSKIIRHTKRQDRIN